MLNSRMTSTGKYLLLPCILFFYSTHSQIDTVGQADNMDHWIVGKWKLRRVIHECVPVWRDVGTVDKYRNSYIFFVNGTFAEGQSRDRKTTVIDSGFWSAWIPAPGENARLDLLKYNNVDTTVDDGDTSTFRAYYDSGGGTLLTVRKNKFSLVRRCSWTDGQSNTYIYKRRKFGKFTL